MPLLRSREGRKPRKVDDSGSIQIPSSHHLLQVWQKHKHHLTISSIGKIIHRQHNVQQEHREQLGILIDISLTSLTLLNTDTFVEINVGNTKADYEIQIAENPSRFQEFQKLTKDKKQIRCRRTQTIRNERSLCPQCCSVGILVRFYKHKLLFILILNR